MDPDEIAGAEDGDDSCGVCGIGGLIVIPVTCGRRLYGSDVLP